MSILKYFYILFNHTLQRLAMCFRLLRNLILSVLINNEVEQYKFAFFLCAVENLEGNLAFQELKFRILIHQ